MDEGTLKETPIPSMELSVSDFKGKDLDPIIEQDSHKFLLDDSFVNFRAFFQFAWRLNISDFEERCQKRKQEQPNKDDSIIKDEIK